MALNKIDGVKNISKQLNRWRDVVISMSHQSRNAHVANRPLPSEQAVAIEGPKKITDNLSWSKNSPVSLLVETTRKPQHNRTLELKKAAAQLIRSNECLKAHYIQKRNDRTAEELAAKEPQTAQKLANLMSLNITIEETKRPRSSSSPARRMETNYATGTLDFKPQSNQSVRWQYKRRSNEINSFDEAGLQNAKDLLKGLKKPEQPEGTQHPQQKSSEEDSKQGSTMKTAKAVNKLQMGTLNDLNSEDGQDWRKSVRKQTEATEPISKNLNSLAKWKIGTRSIPRLDI
ncbi:uncharacterized protein LOC108114782 isoform X2 [Drosophila eugracilis]|uniref:uncharacterized protein LOC108114782 isoform X2 n=1 Tax=Drosophila eugracilis TaxID=29029 RepID=UPI001BD9769F|nr:uncharacterized protein LOC108114782 isoform X2 [Drosophila eugracilis]